MYFEIALFLLSSTSLCLYFISHKNKRIKYDFHGRHVVITGGSQGIGYEIAVAAIKEGANVSLLARNKDKLLEAKNELLKLRVDETQKVHIESIDISKDFTETKNTFDRVAEANGPVDVLVNNAGIFKSLAFTDLTIEEFDQQMKTNYNGSVYCTKCVVDTMKARKTGRIVFVSSQAGQIGVFGYTAYSPTKFALKGFCESLQMELRPHNIYMTLVYPPDTDTPGLKEENLYKPLETRLIADESGVIKPSVVASSLITAVKNGEYNCSFGLNGFILTTLNSGTSPVSSFSEAFLQLLTLPLCRLIGLILGFKFDRTIEAITRKKEKEQLQQKQQQ